MIIEHAILNVRAGQRQSYERAIQEAIPLISATPGFIDLEVRRCLEHENRYLLIVRWQSLEDHTVGFRKSDRYARWSALLHGFYEPFPEVDHYGAPVVSASAGHDL
jgi:heme-degrading monooxygenase HmoA